MKGIGHLSAGALVVAGLTAATAGGAPARSSCPVGALVLPHGAESHAAKAALAQAARAYPGLNTRGAKVVSATRATKAGPRGAQVGRTCGARARARTIVVELNFPRMAPSASLSEGVVDVSRFANGYRIWAVVH